MTDACCISPIQFKGIHALRDWGHKRGATEVCIQVATGVHMARTDRFLRRIGFAQTGGNYSMEMP